MGTVQIRDGRDVAEYEVAAVDGVLRVDLDASDGTRVETHRERPAEYGDPPPDREAAAALLGPAVTTLLALAVGVATGFAAFDPARTGVFAHVLRVAWFAVAAAGTTWLVADAKRRAAAGAAWTPNPWLYVASGAATLTAASVAAVGVPATATLPVLAGVVIVSGFAASVVAGPVYFLRRRRRGP